MCTAWWARRYLRTYVSQYHTAYALRLYGEMKGKGLFPTIPVWAELINLAADTRGMVRVRTCSATTTATPRPLTSRHLLCGVSTQNATALSLYVRLMEHLGDDVTRLLHVPGVGGDPANEDPRLPTFHPTNRGHDTLQGEGFDNNDALVSARTYQRLVGAAVKVRAAGCRQCGAAASCDGAASPCCRALRV